MDDLEKLPHIEIVAARAEDAEGIQKLMHESVFKTYINEKMGITADDVLGHYKDELSSEGLEKLAKELAEPEVGVTNFVAKDKNMVVGYCRVTEKADENELTRIHILPDRKRSGVGTLLWKQVENVLGSDKDIVLWVVDYNENAIEVYKRWGFVDTGERREGKLMKSGAHRTSLKMVLKAARPKA